MASPILIALAAAAAALPLAQHRWHDRLLIVFAPGEASPDLAEQRRDTAAATATYTERDLAVVEVVGDVVRGASDSAGALRRRFHVPGDAFRAVLVGKDGTVALTAAGPLPAARLAAVIDAMPMRQDEMRRR